MAIYTSFYGNLKELEGKGMALIAISRGIPNGFPYSYKDALLAPSPAIFYRRKNGKLTNNRFKEAYFSQLDQVRFHCKSTLNYYQLLKIDVVLLCHENPKNICHRHFLREYAKKEFGIEIKEYGYE